MFWSSKATKPRTNFSRLKGQVTSRIRMGGAIASGSNRHGKVGAHNLWIPGIHGYHKSSLNIYIYIYTYIVCIYIYTSIYIYIYTCSVLIYVPIIMHVRVYAHVFTCQYIYQLIMRVCVCAGILVYIHSLNILGHMQQWASRYELMNISLIPNPAHHKANAFNQSVFLRGVSADHVKWK